MQSSLNKRHHMFVRYVRIVLLNSLKKPQSVLKTDSGAKTVQSHEAEDTLVILGEIFYLVFNIYVFSFCDLGELQGEVFRQELAECVKLPPCDVL